MKKLIPKRETENSGPEKSRARAERRIAEIIEHEPTVRKIVKKAASIAELMTEQDLEDDVRVFRQAKNANFRTYDNHRKDFTEYPDHKTRLAAAALSRAYVEGTPVQRQVVLTHKFDGADATIARIKASPELLAAVKTLQGSGLEIEAGGEVIDVETEFHKTGSENGEGSTE